MSGVGEYGGGASSVAETVAGLVALVALEEGTAATING